MMDPLSAGGDRIVSTLNWLITNFQNLGTNKNEPN